MQNEHCMVLILSDNSPNSFAQNTSMANQINKVDFYLYCVGFNNVLSIFKIVVFGPVMKFADELSTLVFETAGQRHATLKDFRAQDLALERANSAMELNKFEPIGTHQEEIAKKFCSFRI